MGDRVSAAIFAVLASGVIASPVLSQGQIYRWKDANGQVHLTDSPPPAGAESPQRPPDGDTGSSSKAPSTPKATSTPNEPSRGLTWGVRKQDDLPPNTVDVSCHGGPKVDPRYAHEGSCNPYHGDTSCSVRLPLLCFKSDGSAGGRVAITAPIAGTALTSAERADAFCSTALGTGWRMAEFHDGKGGWGFVAHGHINTTSRFWVHINDQPGNCWGSGSAAASTSPDTPRTSNTPTTPNTPQPPQPPRMAESEARSRLIDRQLAAAKPAAPLPLAAANQALQRALAAQVANLEEKQQIVRLTLAAEIPKDAKQAAEQKDRLNQSNQLFGKMRQALASARIAQLTRCGTVEEAGNSVLACDGQVDLVDTCGQSRHVRDLLMFRQQGARWITGESTEILQQALQECRPRP
jgi:hypothetical protein